MITPPFSVQIELVQGCNLQCPFCGINAIQDPRNKHYQFMSEETFCKLLEQLPVWNARLEFAMHGEPTLHPQFYKFMERARAALPKASIMVTTNGYRFIKGDIIENFTHAFDAGVNVIALDEYEYVNYYKKIRVALYDESLLEFDIVEYPKDKRFSPNKKWPPRTRLLILVQDISKATHGTHAKLSNHAGAAAPLTTATAGKRCTKPFREIAVRWDGSVSLCCETWDGPYNCGNINTLAIEKIWEGRPFEVARRFLYHGQRPLAPCKGCSHVGYRVGLLPDPKGKETVPAPTSADLAYWRKKLREPVLTPTIRPIPVPDDSSK